MMRVFLNGTEVYTTGLRVENIVTRAPDTASFTLQSPDVTPVPGMSVLIYRDTTVDTLFGGVVVSVNQSKLAPHNTPSLRAYEYRVDCSDYQKMLDRYLVVQAYEAYTCKQIIQDFVTNFTDPAIGFTTTNVSDGPVIASANFNYERVSNAITQLADMVGYDWYVDSTKDIHFFDKETRPAPFEIDDAALYTKVNSFSLVPDYTQIRNRVTVRGGTYDSDPFTESFVADGQQRIWPLGFPPNSVLALTVGGVATSYGQEYVDAGGDYYWSRTDKYLRCAAATSTPAASTVISIIYKYPIPVLIRADNDISQAAIAAIEGGTGIYEGIIKDDTITSKEEAQDRAYAEVNTYGNPIISGSFTTYEHSFRAGQYVTISCSGYGMLAGNYQIHQVLMVPHGRDEIQYTVTFSTNLYELKDLILSMLRIGGDIVIRSDEIVDVLKVITEFITITDTVETEKLVHPSVWNQFKWSAGTWS